LEEKILEELKEAEDFDVVFAFLHYPDTLQHLSFTRPQKIRKLYMDLNIYVSALKRKVKAPWFLIVSDHGFDLKEGIHSKHGFYSSNIPLNPKPKRITDFYPKIIKWSNFS